jgi:hypothetical protein
MFSNLMVQPPVFVFPFPAGHFDTPPAMPPSGVSRAAPAPPLPPLAVPVPFAAPDVGLLPSAAPRAAPEPLAVPPAAPVPLTAPHVAPAPPTAPRAAPLPPARYTEPVQVYQRRPVPPPPLASPAPPLEVPVVPPVRYVYKRRSTPPPPPAPSLASSPPPPLAPTPPLPPPPPPPPRPSRMEPAVYHPSVIHRDPHHTHPMVTQQADGVLWPRALFAIEGELQLSLIPTSVREALTEPNRRRVMEEEYTALLANQTWDLVPRPSGCNVVTGNLIWTKRRADDTLERYKARWVLGGFTQRPGVDYDEIFSLVVKPATVCTVLSLALSVLASAPARCQECISSWHSDRDSLLQPANSVCGLVARIWSAG